MFQAVQGGAEGYDSVDVQESGHFRVQCVDYDIHYEVGMTETFRVGRYV